jgi:nucleoside-diphosphate kinase
MIERTLVLLKPDAVQRCVSGELISRFERAGLKIVGMKMAWANEDFAKQHYTEDIAIRRGEAARRRVVSFIVSGPVIAMVLEGISAVEVVRKIVGETEPKKAAPGTIRGDYAHMSFAWADAQDKGVPNLIHASGNVEEAKSEVALWFKPEELHTYKTVHDLHVVG